MRLTTFSRAHPKKMWTPLTMRHVLNLSSNQADRYPLGRQRSDDVVFDISSSALTVTHDQILSMCVESACIPVAGYPVNATTNTIYFSSISGDQTATIPIGVYASGPALVAAMNTATTAVIATGLSFTWIPLTSRISALRTNTTVYAIDAVRTTAKVVIGSGYADIALPLSSAVLFPGVIDLSGPKKILITSDVELRTRDSVGNCVNVLAAVPVNVLWGGLVCFQNQSGGMLPTNRKALSEIRLTLLDEDQLPLDLNGLEWAVTIVIELY